MQTNFTLKNILSLTALLAVITVSGPASAIKKCKDSEGNWHYGDIAVAECENSKITTLTERGFVKEEEAAPKSEAELAAEAEENALQQRETQEKLSALEEKRRILSIYETEDDIDRQRDNQVRSVQSNIDVHESYLANMEKRIARYEQKLAETKNKREKQKLTDQIAASKTRMQEYSMQLESLETQKAEILARFKKERETYLALKNSED